MSKLACLKVRTPRKKTEMTPLNSSKFGYSKECLLVSYVPKKNKNVLMLSTMHKQGDIDVESGEQRNLK